MVNDFNFRIKKWTQDTCIIDVIDTLVNNLQAYTNYANNHDTIISTIDKLNTSNARFHDFLLAIDKTPLTNMMKLERNFSI